MGKKVSETRDETDQKNKKKRTSKEQRFNKKNNLTNRFTGPRSSARWVQPLSFNKNCNEVIVLGSQNQFGLFLFRIKKENRNKKNPKNSK